MLVEQFKYKRWADLRTVDAIECIDSAKYLDSTAFALQQVNHMVIVEELFKARLLDQLPAHADTNSAVVPQLSELKKRLEDSYDWYLDFVSNIDREAGKKKVPFVFADGRRGSMSVIEILFHIVNHSTYHRGSIAQALDLAGIAHPVDGYGIYIHEKEPCRRE